MMGEEDKELLKKAYYKACVTSLGELCDFLFKCGLLKKEVSKGSIYKWYSKGLSLNIKNTIKLFLSDKDLENYQKLQGLTTNNPKVLGDKMKNSIDSEMQELIFLIQTYATPKIKQELKDKLLAIKALDK